MQHILIYEAICLNLLGEVSEDKEDYYEAIRYQQNAYDKAKDIGSLQIQLQALWGLASVNEAHCLDDVPRAIGYYKLLIKIVTAQDISYYKDVVNSLQERIGRYDRKSAKQFSTI